MKKFIVCVLVSGCGTKYDNTKFPADIQKAQWYINEAFNNKVFISEPSKDPKDKSMAIQIYMQPLTPPVIGFTSFDKVRISIQVDTRINYDESLPVLLHEMGHALGLRHSKIEGDIMYPSVPLNEKPEVLARQLNEHCKHQVCGKNFYVESVTIRD